MGTSSRRWRISLHIAAIRELFEEAGVLLAEARAGRAPTLSQAPAALVGGDAGAQTVAETSTCGCGRLPTLASRRVTPPIPPRRFDARFFAAELPPAQACRSKATRSPRTRG